MNIILNKHHTGRKQTRRPVVHCFCYLLMLFFYPVMGNSDNHSAVLVCSKNSTIDALDILDVRRIFLGLQPVDKSQTIKPVINLTNKKLYKDFLKNVLHMTEDGYKRKIIKRVFRQGSDYIVEARTTEELIKQLTDNPDEISFITPEQARELENIRIVQTLW